MSGCLHLIPRHDWEILIKRMQENTVTGGLHVIGVFTDTVPEPEDQRGLMVGLFKEGELLELYRDWHTHPGGITHEHAGNDIGSKKN